MKDSSSFVGRVLIVFAMVAAVALVNSVSHLLPPIVLGLLLGYVLYPVIRLLDRIGLPKGIGVLLIFIAASWAIIYSVYTGLPLVRSEIELITGDQNPAAGESRIYGIIDETSSQLFRYGLIAEHLDAGEVIGQLKILLKEQSAKFIDSLGGGVAAQAGQFVMIFLFVFTYALLDGHKLNRTITGFIPNALFEPGTLMLRRTTELFGAYLRGLVIENFLLGMAAFLMLLVLGLFTSLSVTLCALIALAIAVTNVVRIVGPFVGIAIGVVLILVSDPDLIAVFGVVAIGLVIQLLDNVLVLPLVMKEQVDVHPVVSLLSVIVGGSIGGILGMIIAIPVAGAIKIVFHIVTVEQKRFQLGKV